MVKRRLRNKLVPRSFLAGADLDRILGREAVAQGMTKSQLVRRLLIKQLAYQGVKGAAELKGKGL